MPKRTAVEELKDFEISFPRLYAFGLAIESGEITERDGFFTSENTDDSPWNCNGYFKTKDNKIVAIGQELGREGGWFWFRPEDN